MDVKIPKRHGMVKKISLGKRKNCIYPEKR